MGKINTVIKHTHTHIQPHRKSWKEIPKIKSVTRAVAEDRILGDLIFHFYTACKLSLMNTNDLYNYKSVYVLEGGCILFKRSISIWDNEKVLE